MKHKARIILNYDGSLWYEIEGEDVSEIASEIGKVYESKDFFDKAIALTNKGFAHFEPETDVESDIVETGLISSGARETVHNKTESQIRSEGEKK